ncbi:MAG TPA: PfkB family carbohydrate kinase [Candidatus Nanoarchaeia archaeon]|nr:PfkB family carbohydrate kinase [Candidatus Nanoarchaeia archaeon]
MKKLNNDNSETIEYLKQVKKKINLEHIKSHLEKLKDLNVLVIGDTIIDEYVFVGLRGRAIKDPILSTEYKFHEAYAGGILAIANHISSFVGKVKLVTLIGDTNSKLNFIRKSLRDNIDLKTFTKKEAHTTVKKRYIDHYRNHKLFKIEYINDKPISAVLSGKVVNYLHQELPKYDFVMVGDFGHGFLNTQVKKKLQERSKFLAVNAQSNSSNMGYNYLTLYRKPDFITMSEEELRLPLFMRFEDIEQVIAEAQKNFKLNHFIVSIGKHGSIYVNKNKIFKAPILIQSVKDTVGAGDALFALTSLFAYSKANPEFVPFIGNCAGGIAANIMGNKESVTKEKLLSFAGELLK